MCIRLLLVESLKIKQNDRIIVHTYDYLATSNQIELRVQKSSDTKIKLIFEQIQNLQALYNARPKFGPESCESSLNYMSNLKPIEHYFETLDNSIAKTLENLGPEMNRIYLVGMDNSRQSVTSDHSKDRSDKGVDDYDITENELTNYSLMLKSYLDEQPIERDRELIYSTGKLFICSLI